MDVAMDFAVLTTNEAHEGKTQTEIADSFYDDNGYGMGKNKSGILYYIDMYERIPYLSTGGTMIHYMTDHTILRPAHIYSEESKNSKLLFHSFATTPGASYHLDRIRKGKPIILHGDDMSIWNVTHGSDAARAFVGAMNNPVAYGKAYTVCADECMSFRECYTAVQQEMKAPPIRFVFVPMNLLLQLEPERAWLASQNFMFNNVFDNTAAKRDLGLKQTVSWRDGIRRCLEKYEQTGYEDSDKPEFAFYDRIIDAYCCMCDELIEQHKNF